MSATLEQVSALHRYFVWADRMRLHSDQGDAKQLEGTAGTPPQMDERFFRHPYRSYWYAATFVVIEGWKDLGLSDSEIDSLLSPPYVDALQRYRNGVFHFQRRYFDARFLEFTGASESASWISRVREAFHRWFADYIGELDKKEEPSNG